MWPRKVKFGRLPESRDRRREGKLPEGAEDRTQAEQRAVPGGFHCPCGPESSF